MAVNGAWPTPAGASIATNNPNGGAPATPDTAANYGVAGGSQTDTVVTTNASGAFSNKNRPIS